MKAWKSLLALILVGAGVSLCAGSAFAQATRTWVSGVGDDANPCSRTAPCKTFAGAISKTAAGGEINTIDNGAFGTVTITKSITISTEENEGGVLGSSVNGIIVNGAGIVVVLRGLDIDGATSGLNGVRFLNGASLTVDDCTIRNFNNTTTGNGHGILFSPSASAKLTVLDTKINNNGVGGSGAGIHVAPTSGGSANVVIRNTEVSNSNNGIRADAANGAVDLQVKDAITFGNVGNGLTAKNGSHAMVDGLSSSGNGAQGVMASGAGSVIRIAGSMISGNGGGVLATGGGQILSYGNNQIDGNTANGAVSSTIPFH